MTLIGVIAIGLILNGCQFTRHGVKRINPYTKSQMVANVSRLPKSQLNNPKSPALPTAYPDQNEGVWIKVLIFKGKHFTAENNLSLKKNKVIYGGKSYPLESGQVTFDVVRDNPIIINGNAFFGKIQVTDKDQIYVVNILPLEDYLLGVVRKEISYSWPDEAIRAQAIAARSYGYRKYLENYDKPYHLKGNTSDQAFAGTLDVHENIIRGVRDTAGKILVYDNYPILTFFHASCGGMTEKASVVWPGTEELDYFQNIRCNFCTTHPRYSWEYQADVADINNKLSKKLGKKVKSFYVNKFSSSGRVAEVIVSTGEGKESITGNNFRLAVGPKELFSTKFKIKRSGSKYYITGNGYGHGVGLCQWGAKTMAEKGYSAKKILTFYYHKVRFSSIESIEKKLRSNIAQK